MTPEEKILFVAAKYQSVKFSGVSLYDRLTNSIEVDEDQVIDVDKLASFLTIDRHTATLTPLGEKRLQSIVRTLNEKNISIDPLDETKTDKTTPLAKERTPRANTGTERTARISQITDEFKGWLNKKGSGFFRADEASITAQIKEVLRSELGATDQECKDLVRSIQRDFDVVYLSFPRQDGTSRREVEYCGLLEFGDDPLSQAQFMVGDLRASIDEYGKLANKLGVPIAPDIKAYQELSKTMSITEWTAVPYTELETYINKLFKALQSLAGTNRRLATEHSRRATLPAAL